MAQTDMTIEEKTNFNYNFHQYALHESNILTGIPWVMDRETYQNEYYTSKDLPRTAHGMTYSYEDATEVEYDTLTNPPVAIWKDLRINDVDRQILSRTNGMAIENAWARSAARLFVQEIAYAIYQGNTLTGMSGLIAKAGNNDTTASAVETAPNFVTVCASMKKKIWDDGFKPPYVWIMSSGLQKAWDTTIHATPTSEITQGDVIKRIFSTMNDNNAANTGTVKILWELNGTTSGNTIYPLPAADNDDSVALLLKPVQDGKTYIEGVWHQPIVSTDWKFNATTNMWHTRIKCKVGLRVYDTDAICKHTDIDHA